MQEPTTEIVHGYTPDELNAIIDKKVLAERERCAKVLERCAQKLMTLQEIVAEIRSGK